MTFLSEQDWAAPWESLELLQRIYDSICVDSSFGAEASKPPSAETCVSRLRTAAAEDDWATAFTATKDFLTAARTTPSARRARLCLGCAGSRVTAPFSLDDFALMCASLFAHWPRVELPDCQETVCDEHFTTLSCEGESVRAICKALHALRISFCGELTLDERHLVKKLAFVTCGCALAHSAAIEGLFPVFFYCSATTPFDLSQSLTTSGFLQGLAEVFALTLARHQQWFYLLLILAHSSETGRALFLPIIEQTGSKIACRLDTTTGLRVPTAAVLAFLTALSTEDSVLTPGVTLTAETKESLVVSLIALVVCRSYNDEVLVDRAWHRQLMAQSSVKEEVSPQFVLQQLKVFLTKSCDERSDEPSVASALELVLTAYVFKSDPNLGEKFSSIYRPPFFSCKSQLRNLWGSLHEGRDTVTRYYAVLELLSRICESFMLTSRLKYPCQDDGATETLNTLTGCRLTAAEVWLMRIIESYEAEYGMPSDLPGLSGPRRQFTQALNLTSHTIQCLVEPVVRCCLPPSAQLCPNQELLPAHIVELLPGCLFKKVAATDMRCYLGWRALGLEIVAIGSREHQRTKTIAPHLTSKRLIKAFIHLYTESANPRAIHLLHRLLKTSSPCDPLTCFSDVSRVFGGDDSEDEESVTLHTLLASAQKSQFVLMADAATQLVKKRNLCEETERPQIIEQILEIYLNSNHANDAAEFYPSICDLLTPDQAATWKDKIDAALFTDEQDSTTAPPSSVVSSPTECKKWKKALSLVGDDAQQAIQLFYQLRDAPGGLPDVSVANKIIHACVSGGELAKAEELFHVLRADAHSRKTAVRPDVVTGNIILKSYAKWKPPRVDDMEKLVQEMETDFDLGGDGVVADQVTFNTFINAAVTAGSFSKAWEYFGIMKRRKIPADGFTCSILMKQIGPSTRPELITEILQLLAELDPCEDPVLLSSMVDVYSRLRDYGRLRAALMKYERRVPKPIPYAMATLVKGWGRCGDVQKAAVLWDRLESIPGLQLTQYLCSCGVDAFVTNGDLERGLAIYRRASAAKIIVSDVQSSHLIRVCTQRRRLDDALRIYKDMRANQLQPCDVTYNNLMHLCVLADDLETAVEILNDMSTNAKHQPDVVTYSTIIKGLCDRGAMKLAMQLFEEIPSRGVNPDIVAYNTLLEGFARADQQPQVESLFSRLLSHNVKPTCYTLTILIRFYGRRRCLDQVFHLIETLPKLYDIKVDAYVYTATIAACTWNGRVDKAFEFLNAMRENFDASARTYGTLVAGCVKSHTWTVLSQVLKAAMQDNIVLGKRDIASLNDLCQQFTSKTIGVRWLRAGFDAGALNELKQFLSWHSKRG